MGMTPIALVPLAGGLQKGGWIVRDGGDANARRGRFAVSAPLRRAGERGAGGRRRAVRLGARRRRRTVLAEDRNRVAGGDRTRHPEFELARWAAANLTPEERRRATVYTSGEHCPMCAAAHGWVGLGRIVYATSSAQLVAWLAELGVAAVPGPAAADPRGGAGRRGRRTGGGARGPGARPARPLSPQVTPHVASQARACSAHTRRLE